MQAVDIEREGPGIIERLPEALFKAVKRNAVPDDLERDVTALAEWLQPQVRSRPCSSCQRGLTLTEVFCRAVCEMSQPGNEDKILPAWSQK